MPSGVKLCNRSSNQQTACVRWSLHSWFPSAFKALFTPIGRLDPSHVEFQPVRDWSRPLLEKFLRVTHLLALLIAGLSTEGQNLLWVTDEDAIAANERRVPYLSDAFGRVISHLLSHNLGHIRLATAKQDKGDRSVEDLLAIPDIIAGALSAGIDEMIGRHGAPPSGFYMPRPSTIANKTRRVLNWFADSMQPLRRIVILIDETPDTHKLRATHLRFHGTRDFFVGTR